MPKGTHIAAWELENILQLYKGFRKEQKGKMECYKLVAEVVDRSPETVRNAIMRMRPTTTIAQDLIKAKAYTMARRTIARAKPAELIDILSRPNIGVLAPRQNDGNGDRGFFLAVSAESCGAVKAVAGTLPRQELPAAPKDVLDADWDAEDRIMGSSKNTIEAARAARLRIINRLRKGEPE